MDNKYFLHQIKRITAEGAAPTFDKGIVVKDSFKAAKQGYHAYLGAYAYGQSATTDFGSCMITDMSGSVLMSETWLKPAEEQPAE